MILIFESLMLKGTSHALVLKSTLFNVALPGDNSDVLRHLDSFDISGFAVDLDHPGCISGLDNIDWYWFEVAGLA